MQSIQLWHGSRRWVGSPEIRAPKQGRYECGPGLYLTNRYLRARDYAKAGGVTTLVTLRKEIGWLEKTKLPFDSVLSFIQDTPRLRNRADILEYFVANRAGSELVPAATLVNLCVNHEAVAGKNGVVLAEWLTAQGIDASLHRVNSQEQWVVVFNPKIIQRYEVIPASKVRLEDYELPLVQG